MQTLEWVRMHGEKVFRNQNDRSASVAMSENGRMAQFIDPSPKGRLGASTVNYIHPLDVQCVLFCRLSS